MNDVVETASGKVRGSVVEGTLAFRTIPYGASTAGANRFFPPQPVAPWSGVRDFPGLHRTRATGRTARGDTAGTENFSGAPDPSPENEDCLSLNVWTPAGADGKRPVMVWFHGGGSPTARPLPWSRRPQPRGAARRGGGHRQPSAQRARLPVPGRSAADLAGAGNAGMLDLVAGAGLGARQHRRASAAIPGQRHHLRRVGRRRARSPP